MSVQKEFEQKKQAQDEQLLAEIVQAEAEYAKSNPDYENVLTSMVPFIGQKDCQCI
ncbi:hypothetical protein [Aquirhabdus parva]|uniref:hypothetical protein n=1 Tax=Aquirhabdus parva TaxID=2283318 RepID=UPI0013B45962|nr:hypothetical protein [Aquirhabdus parva]